MAERIIKGCEYLLTEVNCAEVFTPEDFTDEHRQIGETTEQFVENEIVPHREEIENQNFELVVEGMQKAGELGLLMIDAPEEYGGLELDKVTSMLVAEKMALAGSFSVSFIAHTGIGTLPLIYFGTSAQKEQYLEKIITGEWCAAYCLTEPGFGSDALGGQASAILSEDGKSYILNGTKQFITNGGFSNLFTVFAKIDKQHFTAFLVEKDFEGLVVGAEEKKLGIKGSSTTQIILDNCKVPVENVLGEIGKGHKIAFNVLNIGRFKLGANVVGMAKVALVEGVTYANERKQFGQPISNFGAIQEKIADMVTEIFAAESLTYRLAGLLDTRLESIDKGTDNYYEEYLKGIEEYAAECAIAKVYCSEVLARAVDEALQIHGGYGFISEYPVERLYRDERINRLFEGTNEINRLLVPGNLLIKGKKGELSLQDAVMDAMQTLSAPAVDIAGAETPFSREKELVGNLKKLCLILLDAAVQRYADKLQREQEVMLTIAEAMNQIFALESAVLRAEKSIAQASPDRKQWFQAVAKLCAYDAAEKTVCAVRKGAFFVAEGESLATILGATKRFGNYDAVGLLEAKRMLASAAITAEKYVF
jgi:alkylation response protein AidB-like acyl-CoA dehydrogenase